MAHRHMRSEESAGSYLLIVNASGAEPLQRAEAILRTCGAGNLATRAQP